MKSLRKPAVAGTFYPADPDILRRTVQGFLDAVDIPSIGDAAETPAAPKAMIVPHAGYVYSGQVAAAAYARLAGVRDTIRRVVLVGPTHWVRIKGLAASSARGFETPLGTVPLDGPALNTVLDLPGIQVSDTAHAEEHSLEVQLPFLQEVLSDFRLVPLVVGEAATHEVARILDALWGGGETLVVISSDLSHFHDYDSACRLDRSATKAIEGLRPEALGGTQACGARPIRGLLAAAPDRGLKTTTVALQNSGDVTGTSDRVVGYGAYVFH